MNLPVQFQAGSWWKFLTFWTVLMMHLPPSTPTSAFLAHSALAFSVPEKDNPPFRPNILYLMADDMRPQLGCYGNAFMSTPHLDKL